MMFCPRCGHQNAAGGTACSACGAQLPLPSGTVAPGQRPMLDLGGPKPPSHLVWAILATLFCCLPTGIAAIVFAAQVDGKYASGDYAGAQAASANAKTWSWVSFGLGLGFVLLYVLVMMAAVVGGGL